DEIASLDRGQCLGCTEQRDGGTGTAAQMDVIVGPRALDDFEKVTTYFLIDVDVADRFLTGQHLRSGNDRVQLVDRMAMLHALEHLGLFVEGRITQAETNKEAVELGLG